MANGRWRGLSALVRDAVDATTDLVGVGHASAHRGVQRVADATGVGSSVGPVREVVHLGTRGTLASVKAVNRLVGLLTEAAFDAAPVRPDTPPVPLRSDVTGTAAWMADAALGAVNGSVGDHLAASGNPLDLGLQLRVGERYLTDECLDEPVLVMVHGLATTEWCWSLDADVAFGDPAASLATELGAALNATPVLVRYNTGRDVQTNGRELAEALERHLTGAQPVWVVGHSMGGLVARAACVHAREQGHRWLGATDWVISLGTPHEGAPLARFGAAVNNGLTSIDTPATQVLAGVVGGRSAGIRDLERGALPGLVEGPRYAFFGTTLTKDPDNPAGRLVGDLLVQTGSAAGLQEGEPVHRELLGGIPHFRIQADARVLEALKDLLAE